MSLHKVCLFAITAALRRRSRPQHGGNSRWSAVSGLQRSEQGRCGEPKSIAEFCEGC
jgi:hypothetical protein